MCTAMLHKEAADDAAAAGEPAGPEGTEEVEIDADADADAIDDGNPFGSWSPSKRPAVALDDSSAMPANLAERVRRLVEAELKRWRADPHEDNRVKAPLLPKKKQGRFKLLQWWMARKNTYNTLSIVAVSYLIVHATAARPERTFSWCGTVNTARRNRLKPRKLARYVFLKRNKRYWPTKEEVVDEYLRRQAAHEWENMSFERNCRNISNLCSEN